jgi:hypothetical protein
MITYMQFLTKNESKINKAKEIILTWEFVM